MANDIAWPPANLAEVHAAMDEWAAWHSGSVDELQRIYGGGSIDARAAYRGGILGKIKKIFWGDPVPSGEKNTKVHVPLAKNIASTSAKLLFSKAPTFKTKDQADEATQARLDEYLDEGVHATLLEAAEISAALGGVYLKVVVDTTLNDKPWIVSASPEKAVPEFKWGKLSAVTFWDVVRESKGKVVRLLERHEPGWIYYSVHEGTADTLGQAVPLTDYSETAYLADIVEDGDGVSTGIETLDVVYVPNMKPNQLWHHNPDAMHLGRSDFAGIEGLMDQLDFAASDWMRDLRLGQSKLLVDQSMLNTGGKGQGASFDYDQELFVPLRAMPGENGSGPLIEQVQFDIRTEEHRALVETLTEQIIQTAGYSVQTFGLNGDVPITATEVNARERQTLATRNQKILYWKPALAQLFKAMLGIDAYVFKTKVAVVAPDVVFPEVATEGMQERAANILTLDQAKAISIYEKVKMAHPEWDEPEIDAEVERIRSDQGTAPSAA